jgi:hypothetical protein
MDYKYTYLLSQFPNGKVDLNTFIDQIRNSTIAVALAHVDSNMTQVLIYFKAELSAGEITTLDSIVANHTGEPGPASIDIVRSEQLTEHIRFVEAGDTTQGLYAAQSLIIDVSAGETDKIVDFTWPYDIALMSGTLGISEDMVGDDFTIDVGPNTLVGALIQPLNVGDVSVYVSPTVLENIRIGYYLGLYVPGGNDGIEISQVIDRDDENYCLSLLNPSDVSANAGSYVAMCAKIIPTLFLHSMDKVEIGKDIPTGQRIPAKLPVRVHYHNNNGVAKKVSFFVEYLY